MNKIRDGKKTSMNMSEANLFEQYFEESDYDTAGDKFKKILHFHFQNVSLVEPKESIFMFLHSQSLTTYQ